MDAGPFLSGGLQVLYVVDYHPLVHLPERERLERERARESEREREEERERESVDYCGP